MIVLQILGVVFLIIILVVGFFVGRFFWRIRKSLRTGSGPFSTVATSLPPINFGLERSAKKHWTYQSKINEDSELLKKLGFEDEGFYETFMGSVTAQLSLWRHPSKHINVAIAEVHADDGADIEPVYFTDITIALEGGNFTVTNNPMPNTLPRPKGMFMKAIETDNLKALLSQLKTHFPKNQKVKPVANFKEYYVDQTQQYNAWIWQEAQLKSPQIATLFEPLKITLDDELVSELVSYARAEESELLQEKILKRLSKQPSLSAQKWEEIRNSLVVVHEKMTAPDIVSSLFQIFGNEALESIEDELEGFSDNTDAIDPFKSLTLWVSKAGLSLPKPFASISKPHKAQIYLGVND
ncbi:hypothetical protein [Reinekea sp.]|jgi:hypothetical protein|uniref:hypothetical protein n=1 Tax=Reinekea sp. TaxID=1970455 RepID=UPI00398A4FA9